METKLCPGCKETKSVDLFSRNKQKPDGYQRECKACMKVSNSKSYHKNKKVYHARSQAHTQKIHNEINEYKASQTCKKCGNSKYYLLEFHHIDPSTKDNDVSTIVKTRGKKFIWEEIAKCVVLCKNCHTDFHYQEREYKVNLDIYLSS